MTKDTDYATSIAGWSFALAKGLDDYDIDSTAVFRHAGIDLKAVTSASTRLPVHSVQKVWRHAYENTDEFFGATVSRFLTPASFHALGFGLYISTNLKELLERLIRYRCVISHLFFAELIEEEEFYRFTTADERTIKTNITHDTLFCFLFRLLRQIAQDDFTPMAVKLSRVPTGPTQKLSKYIGVPVDFNAAQSEILFYKKQMYVPLRFGDKMLAAKQDQLTDHYIREYNLISEYMLRVKTEINRLLLLGEISINNVADNLHVTVRTLQRRLADENSSYHDLLDRVRLELALDYMRDPKMSATQIAFQLGFNDSNSFTRNFKRWTGQSFTEYRKKIRNS